MPLTPQLRATLTAHARKYLIATCKIEKQGTVVGSMGQRTPGGWITVADNVPCRVTMVGQQQGSAVRSSADQETIIEEYQLTVTVDTQLDVDQQVTVGGVVYQIVRLEMALTDNLFKQATMVRRRGKA